MELVDLVGEHMLDGVDFFNEKIQQWGDSFEWAQVCRFRLDGITYAVIEDPDDGYRSSMKEIAISTNTLTNIFPSIRVLGRHRIAGAYGDPADVLELIDMKTGKVVLEVGTDKTDDYYPSFVSAFHPEAMATNA